MLSPSEIKDKSFKKDLMGYNVEEVESFLRMITESYETAYRDNAELQKKIGTLEDKLESYRSEEDVLKYAIIVVSTLPLMCFYPFAQKHFVKGVMIGSLKG